MLDEYLALGGVELGNNARAYAYAQCLPCCAGLLKCPGCDGIHDATNDWTPAVWGWVDRGPNPDDQIPSGYDPAFWRVVPDGAGGWRLEEYTVVIAAQSTEPMYACDAIERAPWYDPDNPASAEFAGFYLLAVQGATDGTMTANVTEGIDDGGVIGAPRHTTRTVRVRTMLVGCSRLATQYGLAWLKAALDANFCSRHGDGCGTSDLAFFLDCPPSLDAAEDDYDTLTAPYRRWLHGVACTSAPIISEEYVTPSGADVLIVEYILTAESPFVWGETISAQNSGAVMTAFDDIPYNLMLYPSGEVGDGVPAVVATQYAFNGSVEFGTTGWAFTGPGSGQTVAVASTDIAAVGPNSYRVRLLATAAVVDATMTAYYDVALGALPAGARPSASMWAAVLTFAGAPTVGELRGQVEWRNATTALGTTDLGVIPLNGGNATATGLTVPAGATIARLRVTASDVDAVAGNDVRMYADAFALTVP